MGKYDYVVTKNESGSYFLRYIQNRISKNKNFIVCITGTTGCQPAGSKVMMADGQWKDIENVAVGDEVLSPQKDGTNIFASVIHTTNWFSENNYDVCDSEQKLYTCSNNHIIPYIKKYPWGWVSEQQRAEDLLGKEIVSVSMSSILHTWRPKRRFARKKVLTTVKSSEPAQVYGFTLDSPSGWYITDNFMVTHNSGKSMTAVSLAKTLDPDFDERNICFDSSQFMDLITGKSKKLKRGANIVWDEMQVKMGHLDFQNQQSKLINACLQTFRFMGFVLWITAPDFSFLNSSVRKLMHCRMETRSIDFENEKCVIKPYLLQVSQGTGKIYRKFLRVSTGKGLVPLKRMKVGLPEKDLIIKYNEKKEIFIQALYEDISKEMIRGKEEGGRTPLSEEQNKVVNLLKEGKMIQEIASELSLIPADVLFQINMIKKKGYLVRLVKYKNKPIRYEVI